MESKRLEILVAKYEIGLKVLEECDKLREEVRESLIGLRYGMRHGEDNYIFIGFYPFDESQHWSSSDCEGLLKEGLVSELRGAKYLQGREWKYRGSGKPIVSEKKRESLEQVLKAEPQIIELQKVYDQARQEIAESEGIDLSKCDSYYRGSEGVRFIEAQRKPEYRHLIRAVIEKIKDVAKAMDS